MEDRAVVAFSVKPTFDWWDGCYCDGEALVVGKMELGNSCYLKDSLEFVGD